MFPLQNKRCRKNDETFFRYQAASARPRMIVLTLVCFYIRQEELQLLCMITILLLNFNWMLFFFKNTICMHASSI